MKHRLAPPLVALAFMWALEILDFVLPGAPLDRFGIIPRSIGSLPGILCAPFLHVGFAHLIANTIPLLVLGLLVSARRRDDFHHCFVYSAFIAGAGTWVFGAPGTLHVGASGVVFGLLGFLLARAFIEKSAVAILLSVVATLLYGGMIFALFAVERGVSWSGHLFGFIGGIIAARALGRRSA